MSTLPRFILLNGRLVSGNRARVSVFDRGFLYGDGLFETLRSYRGVLVGLDDHLARLRTSAAMLGIPILEQRWEERIESLLRANRLRHSDAAVRITVTRGPAPPGLLPPRKPTPTVMIFATPVAADLEHKQRHGIRATLLPFAKLGILAEHKLVDYVLGILGQTAARARGAQEGLYVDQGRVSEGTTSNLFLCRRGRLLTPPVAGLLPGVTRRQILELARSAGLSVSEQPISIRALRGAEEAFLTGSVAEVLPLVGIDDQPVGNGRVGPITRKVQRLYRQMVDRLVTLQRFE